MNDNTQTIVVVIIIVVIYRVINIQPRQNVSTGKILFLYYNKCTEIEREYKSSSNKNLHNFIYLDF